MNYIFNLPMLLPLPFRFFSGEVGFRCLFLQAAHTTEQVQFLRRDTQAHAVFAIGEGSSAAAKNVGNPLARAVGVERNGGNQGVALDSIKRAGLFNVQHRHPQVRIVRKGQFDQPLQFSF